MVNFPEVDFRVVLVVGLLVVALVFEATPDDRLVGHLLAVECSSSPVSPSPSLSPALIAAANFDLRD